jgi:hypothetical protein
MSIPTLFDIAKEYRDIANVLMDTEVDEQTLSDTLEGERWSLELKAQNYGFVIRNMETTAAAIKEAEKQMAARRKALEARTAYLSERLKLGMEIAGVTELSCPHFAIKIKRNPPSVDIFEPGLIPAEFMRQPEPPPAVPDKAAIKAAIQAGREVPGALLDSATRLDIR